MKRFVLSAGIALVCAAALAAQTYKDGFYFAQDAGYNNNQKNQVVIEVKGGKISGAVWNILSLNAGMRDLKTIAKSGTVPQAAAWAAQAQAVEAFLVSSQNLNAASVPGGPANAASFFDLAKKALAAPAVAKGAYSKDGWYYAEAAAADGYHTKNTALFTVVNGTIVDSLWNGILQLRGVNPSKMITSRSNGYPMTGARARWDVQADAAAAALVKAQDPDKIAVKADGKTDAVSGVTMQVKPYIDMAKQALQAAK